MQRSDGQKWFRAACVWCALLVATSGAALALGYHAREVMAGLIPAGRTHPEEMDPVRARFWLAVFGGMGSAVICGLGLVVSLVGYLREVRGRSGTMRRRVERS